MIITALYKIINAKYPKSDLLGESTVNIGVIKSGVASNVIPAHAKAQVLIRVAEGVPKILEIVNDIVKEVSSEHLSIEALHTVDAQLLDYEVPGFDNIVLKYATDVPYLKGNFKRYLYGSGSIHVAHSDHEYVPIKELYDSVDGYKKLVEFSLKK